MKDNKEDLSKSGCGRVVVGKDLHIVHSYTLECGYHSALQLNPIIDLETVYPNTIWRFNQSVYSDLKSQVYMCGPPEFTKAIYSNIG